MATSTARKSCLEVSWHFALPLTNDFATLSNHLTAHWADLPRVTLGDLHNLFCSAIVVLLSSFLSFFDKWMGHNATQVVNKCNRINLPLRMFTSLNHKVFPQWSTQNNSDTFPFYAGLRTSWIIFKVFHQGARWSYLQTHEQKTRKNANKRDKLVWLKLRADIHERCWSGRGRGGGSKCSRLAARIYHGRTHKSYTWNWSFVADNFWLTGKEMGKSADRDEVLTRWW